MITTLQEAAEVVKSGKKIKLPSEDWHPRPDQRPLWQFLIKKKGLRAVQVAHRRWGKDEIAMRFTFVEAMKHPGNYWHMLPEAEQARKVIWDAVNPKTGKKRIDEVFPDWTRRKTNSSEMKIELISGAVWQLAGSDNYNSLVGSPPIGIVFSEWALANPLAWAYLSPILEENKGWALFIYTSRGNNHGKMMLNHARATEGWFASLLTAEETPVFSSEQLGVIRNDYIHVFGPEMGEALFNQEYLCSFDAAIFGAYYAKQVAQARKEGRIGRVPYDPRVEVDTFWDLGIDDSMSIWFCQAVGKERRMIDYYENTGFGLEHYAKVLREKGYVYGTHFMPHDADIREMSTGEVAQTRKQIAESLGIRPIHIVQRARDINVILQVHIPAVRNMLVFCWFDEEKTALGLSALEGYHAEYDEEKKVLSNRPAHNWCSHAADAFRTGAVGYIPRIDSSAAKNKDWRRK